jgi:hypothetical protein
MISHVLRGGGTDGSMVLEKKEEKSKGWWGVHSQKSRMVIWTPEEGFYIYIVCNPFLRP